MTAFRWKLAFVLAVLLTVATAVADKVLTADEIIYCWGVESASTDSIRFTLPRMQQGMLSTFDVYEIRLPDSSRVAKLAAQMPEVRVVLDSGQPVPPPAVRAEQLRQERVREARAEDLTGHAVVMETLAPRASPAEMAARCREMDAALDECGRKDDTVAGLLREVNHEAEALQGLLPRPAMAICVPCGCLLGMAVGTFVGAAVAPTEVAGFDADGFFRSSGIGCGAGAVLGAGTGMAISTGYGAYQVARHRDRMNDLVRRVNRAVTSQP